MYENERWESEGIAERVDYMKTNDGNLKALLNESTRQREGRDRVGFDASWQAAEAQYLAEKRRYRRLSAAAASVAMLAIAVSLLQGPEEPVLPDFDVAARLMESTQWDAPSDALLPDYGVDLYDELPEFPESTDWYEGTLL